MKLGEKHEFGPGMRVKTFLPVEGLEDDWTYFIQEINGTRAIVRSATKDEAGNWLVYKEVELRCLTLC